MQAEIVTITPRPCYSFSPAQLVQLGHEFTFIHAGELVSSLSNKNLRLLTATGVLNTWPLRQRLRGNRPPLYNVQFIGPYTSCHVTDFESLGSATFRRWNSIVGRPDRGKAVSSGERERLSGNKDQPAASATAILCMLLPSLHSLFLQE